MKIFLLLIALILRSFNVFPQTRNEIIQLVNNLERPLKNIYIFCRGTSGKAGLIARQFNRADTNITHVGLGYVDRAGAKIFNVTDIKGYKNALVVDSIGSFIASPDVQYLSIWKYKNSPREFRRMKKLIKSYLTRTIFFDISFQLKDDDTLYCSEFCVNILNKINPGKLCFEPLKKELNGKLYSAILKRKEITYYPVDFFEANKHFSLLCEFKVE